MKNFKTLTLLFMLALLYLLTVGNAWAQWRMASQSDLDHYYNLIEQEERLKFRTSERALERRLEIRRQMIEVYRTGASQEEVRRLLDQERERHQADIHELERVAREVRRLKRDLQLEILVTTLNEGLDSINQNFSSFDTGDGIHVPIRCSPTDTRHLYFMDGLTYVKWLEQDNNILALTRHRARASDYISRCMDRVQEGESLAIKSDCKSNRSVCNRKEGIYPCSPVGYDLQKKDGLITIKTDLFFEFKGESEQREKSYQELEEVKTCMRSFFAGHGINLQVNFVTPKEGDSSLTDLRNKLSCHHTVNLHHTYPRDTASNWAVQGKAERDVTTRCGVFIHELSHLLGLHDTYPEKKCPDRKIIRDDDDIMNNSIRPFRSRFYSQDIEQMLSPLCGNMRLWEQDHKVGHL